MNIYSVKKYDKNHCPAVCTMKDFVVPTVCRALSSPFQGERSIQRQSLPCWELTILQGNQVSREDGPVETQGRC